MEEKKMEPLFIPGTNSTPQIHFDAATGKLVVKGQSYPENAFKFYEPVLAWTNDYLHQLQTSVVVTMELELPYINTSSTKCLMMLLEKFEAAHCAGKPVKVEWICNMDNESEYECAEEFQEDLTLPFEIIEKNSDE
jgi:hypothetical protein